jgi:lysozyme
MTAADYALLQASVKAHEGLRLRLYHDARGVLTIGWGRNLIANGIRLREAESMLENDLDEAVLECQGRFPWVLALDGVRQAALAELTFNLGVQGLAGFVQMLGALQAGRYTEAAVQLRASAWAVEVGATRTNDLAQLLEHGEMHA